MIHTVSEYFHIHRVEDTSFEDRWRVGSIFTKDSSQVNQYLQFYDKGYLEAPSGVKTTLVKQMENYLTHPTKLTGLPFPYFMHTLREVHVALFEQAKFIRETLFEEVRLQHFPNLPSRKTCIWVTEREYLKFWWNEFSKPSSRKPEYKIFKLKLSGVIHRANQKFLEADTLPHKLIKENAYNYWSGNESQKKSQVEVLFEGTIEVIEEFSNINQVLKKP